jgi:hypothetical protein
VMTMVIVYFIGALILLTALIYGILNHHHRDRRRSRSRTKSFVIDMSITEPDWRPE